MMLLLNVYCCLLLKVDIVVSTLKIVINRLTVFSFVRFAHGSIVTHWLAPVTEDSS